MKMFLSLSLSLTLSLSLSLSLSLTLILIKNVKHGRQTSKMLQTTFILCGTSMDCVNKKIMPIPDQVKVTFKQNVYISSSYINRKKNKQFNFKTLNNATIHYLW